MPDLEHHRRHCSTRGIGGRPHCSRRPGQQADEEASRRRKPPGRSGPCGPRSGARRSWLAETTTRRRIEMEPDATAGRHADFRLHQADGKIVDIELKAVGLSNAEVAWHREANEHFYRLTRPRALASTHGWLDRPIWVRTDKLDRSFEHSAQLAGDQLTERSRTRLIPAGSRSSARMTEESYIRRAASDR